ncbi:MAG: hypothetical protein FJ098_03085, partial [Deltaproteobacteria bacterium]|nr:hypothetical protein [Deltaproteobacteria bacterium]
AEVTLGIPCVAGTGEAWTCQVPPGSGDSLTVLATDLAGNTTGIPVWLCRDNQGPQIVFGPQAALGWWGPADAELHVEISDPSGLDGWSVTGEGGIAREPSSQAPIADGVALEIPLSGGSLTVTVTAHDLLGNEASAAAALELDAMPPVFDTTGQGGPLIGSPAVVGFRIGVSDQGSGVQLVEVTSPGAWTVTEEEPPGTFRVSGIPTLPSPPPPVLPVALRALDRVGNASELSLDVTLDLEPPELELVFAEFQDESSCEAFLEPGDVLTYACDGPMVELSGETCSESCPPIVKLASRLEIEEGGSLAEANLPMLSIALMDHCPLATPGDCPGSFSWTLFRGEEPLVTGHAPATTPTPVGTALFYGGLIVLGAEGLFGLPAAEASFAEELVPDRIVITGTDAGGNTASLELGLDITILPPPVLADWTAHADPWIQAAWGGLPSELASALDPASEALEAIAGEPAVEAGHLVITNPTGVPVVVDLPVVPEHEVMHIRQRGYLGDVLLPAGCGPGACAMGEGPPEELPWENGQCLPPEILSALLVPPEETEVSLDVLDPGGLLPWVEEGMILAPGQSVEVSLRVSLAAVPPVLPAVEEEVWIPGEGSFATVAIHFLAGPELWSACDVAAPAGARRYRTTPAISRVHSRTPPEASNLVMETRNPGAAISVTEEIPAGWDLVYLNTWPATFSPPPL